MSSTSARDRVLRVAIVGCGQMGCKHARNCFQIGGVSVVAVADIDRERATALAQDVGAVPYQSAERMIERESLDAVIVATPPGHRRGIVEAAAATGAGVFVEKPIALDIVTARSLCEAVQNSSLVNAVGFHLRYSPLTRRAQSLVASKKVTHVRTLTTTSYYLKMDMPAWFLQRKESGGPLLEQSPHMLDMARYLVGDITHVFGRGDRLVHPELSNFDSEDTVVLAYRFASGALGTDTDSCAMLEFNWEIELFGPDWRLLVDHARRRLCGFVDGIAINETFSEEDLHSIEIQAFLDAVRLKKPDGVLCDFADATRTLMVLLAADRSLRTGAWESVDDLHGAST